MKRILLFVCVMLTGLQAVNAQARATEKKFEIKTTAVSKQGLTDGKIIITVLETKSFFIYGLWDKAPWDEGTELSNSGQVKETTYTFSDLKAGDYMISVQFGDEAGYFETVKVE
jgi:predicted phage tail protein